MVFSNVLKRTIASPLLILLSLLLSWGLYVWLITVSEKFYEVRSLIQVKEENTADSFNTSMYLFNLQNNNLEEEIQIYKSRSNILKLIEERKLNISVNNKAYNIDRKTYFEDIDLFNSRVTDQFSIAEMRAYFDNNTFTVKIDNDYYESLEYNKYYEIGDFNFKIDRKDGANYLNEEVLLNYINPTTKFRILESLIVVAPLGVRGLSSNSLLRVSINSNDTLNSVKIIDLLNDIYLQSSVFKKAKQARSSIDFLDEQIATIEQRLKLSEQKLNDFQRENKFLEASQESKSLLERVVVLDKQLQEIDLELVRLGALYEDTNKVIVNLKAQKDVIYSSKQDILDQIGNLPKIQQDYFNLLRDVEINQSIIESLLNRKIEFSIIEASTLSDVRVIDGAYVYRQTAPRTLVLFVMFSFFGILVGLVTSYFRNVIFAKLKTPGQIQDIFPEHKILGLVPFIKGGYDFDGKNIEATKKDSIDSIITNLMFYISGGAKVITIGGPLKEIGKSTVSTIIAHRLSLLKKKVLLIDTDFRKGDLHKIFGIEKNTMKSYTSNNIEERGTWFTENLFVIPRPANASSQSLAYLSSKNFEQFIENMRSSFDVIIVDTPPILSISDSMYAFALSDQSIIVAKHHQTNESQLKEALKVMGAYQSREMLFVYNYYKPTLLNYGYGYYDYYVYRYYSSDYSYSSDSKDEK